MNALDEWRNCETIWGKLAVIVLYFFSTTTFFAGVALAINPQINALTGCVFSQIQPDDAYTKSWLRLFIQMEGLYTAGFMYLIIRGGLRDVISLCILWVVNLYVTFLATKHVPFPDNKTNTEEKCQMVVFGPPWLFVTWPTFTLFCRYKEFQGQRRNYATSNNTGEESALLPSDKYPLQQM